MMDENFIGVYDGAVSENMCARIIDTFERVENTSMFSENVDETWLKGDEVTPIGKLGRSDKALFFDSVAKAEAQEIHNAVGKCLDLYRKQYVGLEPYKLASYFCKVQRTMPRGGFHIWHSEHANDMWSMRRVAVWCLYLTTHENEGETEFLQQGLKVAPVTGRLVIWPAAYTHPHRGNPVYKDTKYIATGWIEHYIGDSVEQHSSD